MLNIFQTRRQQLEPILREAERELALLEASQTKETEGKEYLEELRSFVKEKREELSTLPFYSKAHPLTDFDRQELELEACRSFLKARMYGLVHG